MAEVYIPLEEAAQFEGIRYNTMVQRMKRTPEEYPVIKEPGQDGGKDRILLPLSALSPQARRAYWRSQKEATQPTRGAVPWYVDADLNQYLERHRAEYLQAVDLVRQIDKFVRYTDRERTIYASAFAAQLRISQRTLYRYTANVQEARLWAQRLEDERGESYQYFEALALCRKPKDQNTFPVLDEEQRALIENIWFDEGFANNLGTVEMLYIELQRQAKTREWESIPSISTVRRYVRYLLDTGGGESAYYLASNGAREWKNQRMIKGKRDVQSLAVMEFVQGDEHTFDCWVQYTNPTNGKVRAVRPVLVAWLDTRSRCILGDVICVHANAQTIKESLVKMLYSHPGGVPKHLHIDNGKDYTAESNLGQSRKQRGMEIDSETKGFYQSIGIEEWSRSLPYQPWGKAQIERFFGTVCRMFTRWIASYTGTLTGSRTVGKRRKDVDGMLERNELLTMQEFYDLWSKWLTEVYHQRAHKGLKEDGEAHIKPLELFDKAENRYIKAPPPREFAAMLLMKAETARVSNQGIRRWGKLYSHYELSKYVGQKVAIKWDVDNVTKLYVYTRSGEKICVAESAELLLIASRVSQEELERHNRDQKRQYKEVREQLQRLRTPFEERQGGSGPHEAVGKLDLTIKADRSDKVVSLPTDRQYREEKQEQRTKESSNEYFEAAAKKAFDRLKEIG